IDYFVREYDRGRTPHPCLACNDKIKFDFLLRRAMFLDAAYIATGHYGRVRKNAEGNYELLKGVDSSKDQSYVLFTLRQSELSRLLLPVGEYPKHEIRRIAAESGLLVADKPDSQEICFIPNNNYREFVSERVKPRPGNLVNIEGDVLGSHPGIQFFTIGQRRRLGLNGNTERPMYVTRIDADSNEVVLGNSEDLLRSSLWASRVNYISGDAPLDMTNVTAKIRYKASEASATVIPLEDGWAEIRFDDPQRAVTPGQAVVFYAGERILGGGYIELEAPVTAPAV
ncbi:MAG: tRNA 2-thiouridine(34) synthase MnmA, partial [Dehalococcoidia bacterium]|nr:tRNA 2-thiouridine(34) synthase MnmA [Dehalococcoidia bacterium]